jgi:hypothetical protein
MSGLSGRFLSRDPIEYEGGWNQYSFIGGMVFRYTDALGLDGDIPETPGSCITASVPMQLDSGNMKLPAVCIPNVPNCDKLPFFAGIKIRSDIKFSGSISHKMCNKMCNCIKEGTLDSWAIEASIFPRVEITGGFDIDTPVPGLGGKIKGYVGVRGEFGSDFRVSLSYVNDSCKPSPCIEVCGGADVKGRVRGGASIRYQNTWGSWELATAEIYVQAGVRFDICFRCCPSGCSFSGAKFGKGHYEYGGRICGAVGGCWSISTGGQQK